MSVGSSVGSSPAVGSHSGKARLQGPCRIWVGDSGPEGHGGLTADSKQEVSPLSPANMRTLPRTQVEQACPR